MNIGKFHGTSLALLAIVITIILLSGLIFTQFLALEEAEMHVVEEKQLLAQQNALLAELKALESQEGELISRIDLLSNFLPDEPQGSKLIRDLQINADDNGVYLKAIRFGTRIENQVSQYTEMPLDIQLEGRYANIQAFVKELQYNERAVRIDEIRMETDGGEVPGVNLRISVFYSTE